MALESSPFSRKSSEGSPVERKELPRAEKPEPLDIYGLPASASSDNEATALTAELNAFSNGWKQYAADRNYYEPENTGPLSLLLTKKAEVLSTARKIRSTYLEYTAAKSSERVEKTSNTSDQLKGITTAQELGEKRDRESEALKAPSQAWEEYQEQIKELEATLKQQLKEMNGTLAQEIEAAVAQNEEGIYGSDKTPAEYRQEMQKNIDELVGITAPAPTESIKAEQEAPTPLEENRRRFEEVVKPAAEQKYINEADALEGKSSSLFSKVGGWWNTRAEKSKAGLRKKLAFFGALGAALVGVGVSTYDNAPRRTENVTRVQAESTSQDQDTAEPLTLEPIAIEGDVNNANRLFGRLADQFREKYPEGSEMPPAVKTLLNTSEAENGMHEQDVLTRALGFQKDGESPYVYEGDTVSLKEGSIVFTQGGVEHVVVDAEGKITSPEEVDTFLTFKKF